LAMSALIWFHDSNLRARIFAILLLVACIASALFAFRKQKSQRHDEDQVIRFLRDMLGELVEVR
jgi:hypothetical protein